MGQSRATRWLSAGRLIHIVSQLLLRISERQTEVENLAIERIQSGPSERWDSKVYTSSNRRWKTTSPVASHVDHRYRKNVSMKKPLCQLPFVRSSSSPVKPNHSASRQVLSLAMSIDLLLSLRRGVMRLQQTSSTTMLLSKTWRTRLQASAPGGLTWRVIGSTETVDAKTHTRTDPEVYREGVPIFQGDGSPMAANYRSMWPGNNNFEAFFLINEFGESITEDDPTMEIDV